MVAGAPELFDQRVEPGDQQARVGLPRRAEVGVHAQVDLDRAALEPGPAASRERRRLGQLGDPEQARVEGARLRLAAGRHGELHVIDADDGQGLSSCPDQQGTG